MKTRLKQYPQPIPYTRALRVLFMREQPHSKILDKSEGEILANLRKRPGVRIVADLFGTSPKQVAEDLFNLGGERRQTLAVLGEAMERHIGEPVPGIVDKTNRLLWATGRGAW